MKQHSKAGRFLCSSFKGALFTTLGLLLAASSCNQQPIQQQVAAPTVSTLQASPAPTIAVSTAVPFDTFDRTGHIAYLTNVFEFGMQERIELVDVSDGSKRPLAIDCYVCDSLYWSSDGQVIAYSGTVAPPSGHSEIFTITLANGTINQVTMSAEPKYRISLSPDGKEAVLEVAEPRTGDPQLGILDMASGRVRLLETRGQTDYPVWSPDGKHLAIEYHDTSKDGWYLWVTDTDGKNGEQISALAIGGQISWSPDSSMIAVSSPLTCGSIYVVQIQSRGTSRLTSTDGCASNPVWSPRGETIAFVNKVYVDPLRRSEVKNWQINLMSINSKEIYTLVSGQGNSYPTYLAWSSH